MAGRVLTCAAASMVLLIVPAMAAASDGNGPSARELARQAKQNLLHAKSVHLKLTDHSTATLGNRTQPVSLDLALDRHGNCTGSMTFAKDGGSVVLVKRGSEVWMKPDAAFWEAQLPGSQGKAAAELFKGRYIHGSTNDALLRGLAGTCDLTAFQKQVDTGPSGGRTLTKGDETKLHGTKVIPLRGEVDGRKSTLYVTSDSPHQLYEATEKGGGTDLTLTFTDYNKPVPSATPSANESIDVGKLQQELQNA